MKKESLLMQILNWASENPVLAVLITLAICSVFSR